MKRIISLILALILMLTTLGTGVYAAQPEAIRKSGVYQYLINEIKTQGHSAFGGYVYQCMSITKAEDFIEFRIDENENPGAAALVFHIPKDLKQPYLANSSWDWGDSAEYSINPAAVTLTTVLHETQYFGGGAQNHDLQDKMTSTLLKTILEEIQPILQKGGYSISDLGFTQYPAGHRHNWDSGTILRAPDCGHWGRKLYTCKSCGSIRSEDLPSTGACKWDQGVVLTAPGCLTTGETLYTCTVCGRTETRESPALGHAWSYTETLTPGEGKEHGTALYTCTRCQETKEGRLCAAEVFTDMPADDNWAHTPIDWAYFSGVTSGKTAATFAPKATVTRAEVVSFLYKAMGSPEPAGTENPFTDVAEGKYYYKPVLWAVGAGVTTGATPTSFAPKKNCTRAQIVTFLWNAAGKPEPAAEENPFTDVSEGKYYYKAVLWASQNGVTGGVTATTFGPGKACTRAQTVTFLYKAAKLLSAEPLPQEP